MSERGDKAASRIKQLGGSDEVVQEVRKLVESAEVAALTDAFHAACEVSNTSPTPAMAGHARKVGGRIKALITGTKKSTGTRAPL